MPTQSRADLRIAFTKGRRPKEQEFWDWLDSFYHKTEDPLKVAGWQFRSFFKDFRAEGGTLPNNTGGVTMIEVPFGATFLRKIRVFGNGAKVANQGFTVSVNLIYFSDILIAGLGGAANNLPQMPTTGFFRHPIVGALTSPALPFDMTVAANPSTAAPFAGSIDLTALNVELKFTEVRFLRLQIALTGINFPNSTSSFLYYGFLFE